jgi:NAD(P)-dependent dehydrogenase (short-subunit alcohol dehydrogenase family)
MTPSDPAQLDWSDRVAVVTGGGRGLGRAYAMLLAERGARVVVNDLGASSDGFGSDPAPAASVVAEIEAAGGTAVASTDSVSTPDGAASIVDTAVQAFGRLDAVVSNAGIVTHTVYPDATAEELARHLSVDPVGPFNVCRAAWPHLVECGSGRVVITSTAAAFGGARELSYATGKMASIGLARALAHAGADAGIKVNAVAPFGFSRMTVEGSGLSEPQIAARRRLAPPELVAAVVLYLVHESCEASGEIFTVGGGRVARVFLGETPGFVDPELTPELVAEHWATVMSTDGYTVIDDAPGYIKRFYASIPGWQEAIARLQ